MEAELENKLDKIEDVLYEFEEIAKEYGKNGDFFKVKIVPEQRLLMLFKVIIKCDKGSSKEEIVDFSTDSHKTTQQIYEAFAKHLSSRYNKKLTLKLYDNEYGGQGLANEKGVTVGAFALLKLHNLYTHLNFTSSKVPVY